MTKKIKLNKTQRSVIEEYGVKHIRSTIDRKQEESLYQTVLEAANQAIRARYPEEHMVILRKVPTHLAGFLLSVHVPERTG